MKHQTNFEIYIDDTGRNEKSLSEFDFGNLSTWVALIIEPEIKNVINLNIEAVRHSYKIEEFHFAEIYAGKKQFSKITIDQRIEIFCVFAELFKSFKIPIIIQSLAHKDLEFARIPNFANESKDGFNFKDQKQLALWFLLQRIVQKDYLKNIPKPIDFYIDSGIQKANTKKNIPFLKDFASNSEITFLDSKNSNFIQLIDFAAYTLNRCRWIMLNNKKSENDQLFLQIASYADFNTLDMKKEKIDILNTDLIKKYDTIIEQAHKINGNLSLTEIKNTK